MKVVPFKSKTAERVKIILPHQYAPLLPTDFLIFLEGPVQGGGDWQRVFIEHFLSVSIVKKWSMSFTAHVLPRIKFIVSCKWDDGHPLSSLFVNTYDLASDISDRFESSKTVWEDTYLKKITEEGKGLIVFGLFPENKESPHTDNIPYAFDTLLNLGRWIITDVVNENDVIMIGINKDFPGIGRIRDMCESSCGFEWIEEFIRDTWKPELLADWVADELGNTDQLQQKPLHR